MDELFSMMILALAGSVVMMVGILLGKDARQSMARADGKHKLWRGLLPAAGRSGAGDRKLLLTRHDEVLVLSG